MKKKKTFDMLNGSIWNKLILFALPLAASSILQQLFNAADVAVVGSFAGSGALAAVGANGPIINLLVNSFVGLSIGANVVIASFIGQNDEKRTSLAAHTSILMSVIIGIVLLFVGFFFARPILELMSTPDDIINLAEVYLKIYFIDVGQGDSTLIVTPCNKKILIDGGGSQFYDTGKNVLLPYLLNRKINKLDMIIISHFDQDHVRWNIDNY